MSVLLKQKKFIFLLFITAINCYAQKSIEFFASNNTHQINIEEAYERLTGQKQQQLRSKMIRVLQKNHLEQGSFKDILGTYQMADNQAETADNTEQFHTSPLQKLSKTQIFSLAREFANTLQQESVAVLIPNSSTLGLVKVTFQDHQPSINEAIKIIRQKLPPSYGQAYSLVMVNQTSTFNEAKVHQIEWLGSQLNLDEIRAAFPEEKITGQNGNAYLIFKDGCAKPI